MENAQFDREKAELDVILAELERRKAREHFAVYAGVMNPAGVERETGEDADDPYSAENLAGLEKLSLPARYIPAEHHQMLCEKLQAIERGYVVADRRTVIGGDLVFRKGERIPAKRLMVFMPPGSAKTTYCSVLFPAWYLGKHPKQCVIQGSYNDRLAKKFGRRARNTFQSPEHQAIFPVPLSKDAAGDWETAVGGEYFSFGMNVGVTGNRADGIILDDIIKGRKDADSKTVRDNVMDTYIGDVRTRRKPGCWIIYVATRWHEDDPAGRILPKEALGKTGWFKAKDGELWYVISLAAVVETQEEEEHDPLGRKLGEHLWPEWFSAEHFAQEKRSQGSRNWNALFQQKPRPDEGAILKKKYWRKWPFREPPKCEYVVSVYDTAFEEGEEDDFSARTTWGIFWHEENPAPPDDPPMAGKKRPRVPFSGGHYCCILLERFKEKLEFPELRIAAKEHWKQYKAVLDQILVEKKSSGHSLIQELRRAKIPVKAILVDRSKLARAHAAAVVLEQGCVWYLDRDWSQEVIDDCAAASFFKGSPGNDIGDTCVYAWLFLRRAFHLQLKDEPGEEADEDALENEQGELRLFG